VPTPPRAHHLNAPQTPGDAQPAEAQHPPSRLSNSFSRRRRKRITFPPRFPPPRHPPCRYNKLSPAAAPFFFAPLSSPSRFLTHHKDSHCRPPRTPEPTSTRTCRSPAAFVSSTAAPQLLHGATQKLAFRRRDNGLGSERLSSRRTGAQPQSRRRVTQQRLARPCRPI
jgi:hypothetical protein